MKKISKFLLFILISIFLFIPSVNAEEVSHCTTTDCVNKIYHSNEPYEIMNYDVNMKVNEDNSYDVTEKIDVYFNEERHGIKRTLPLTNKVMSDDGERKVRAKITHESVNEPYMVSYENNDMILKIGSSNDMVTGLKEYVIKYTYSIGMDKLKDKDEFYYNIVGTNWNTLIDKVTFTIDMPKKFDGVPGFSVGSYGTSGYDEGLLKYNVDGKTITGSYNGILDKGEGINIRLSLPDGYFVAAKKSLFEYLIFIIPIILALASFILRKKFLKNDLVVDEVSFYPPEGLNSLETGFIYKGSASKKDVTSLLIYLANKGYIKIEEEKKKKICKKSYKIIKVKDYDGENENEKTFMDGLFKTKNEVTINDLRNNFYTTTNKIISNINKEENKEKIFEKGSMNKRNIILVLAVLTYCVFTIPPLVSYGENVNIMIDLLFPISGYLIFVMFFDRKDNPDYITVSIMFLSMFCLFPWLTITLPAVLYDPFYLIETIIGFILLIFMTFIYMKGAKRTKYGLETLGKLRGFKNFLENAEKDELEGLVEKNPEYFYDILPYTYVLGVSDKWIKKFEEINVAAPNWYTGYNSFVFYDFMDSFDDMMRQSNSAISSAPSSSSGGSGPSGGGFSGGGSGGGGGSSW